MIIMILSGSILPSCSYDHREINLYSTDVPAGQQQEVTRKMDSLCAFTGSDWDARLEFMQFQQEGFTVTFSRCMRPYQQRHYNDTTVYISVASATDTIRDTLDVRRSLLLEGTPVSFCIRDNKFFVCWISALQDGSYEYLNADCFDLVSKQGVFRCRHIYNSSYLGQPAVYYIPESQLVLFAFSGPRRILYSSIPIGEMTDSLAVLNPVATAPDDNTEHLNPRFTRCGKKIYLYHTSGVIEPAGIMQVQQGKQGLGISEISTGGQLLWYHTLLEKTTIGDELLFMNDTIFYIKSVEGCNATPYRKIAIRDLPYTKTISVRRRTMFF